MGPIRTEAIILRRINYGESDRILQLLTPQNGKLSGIAKGVRREGSKLAGGIELLAVTDLVVRYGKSDMGIITSARLKKFFTFIMEDYDRLQFSYEALKRLSKLDDYLTEPKFYEIAKTMLESLNNKNIPLNLTEAWFYANLSEAMGHGLNLGSDSAGKPLKADKNYRFDIAEMSFVEDEKGSFSADHLKLLKILHLKKPEVIAKLSGIDRVLNDCLSVARAVGD